MASDAIEMVYKVFQFNYTSKMLSENVLTLQYKLHYILKEIQWHVMKVTLVLNCYIMDCCKKLPQSWFTTKMYRIIMTSSEVSTFTVWSRQLMTAAEHVTSKSILWKCSLTFRRAMSLFSFLSQPIIYCNGLFTT